MSKGERDRNRTASHPVNLVIVVDQIGCPFQPGTLQADYTKWRRVGQALIPESPCLHTLLIVPLNHVSPTHVHSK